MALHPKFLGQKLLANAQQPWHTLELCMLNEILAMLFYTPMTNALIIEDLDYVCPVSTIQHPAQEGLTKNATSSTLQSYSTHSTHR